MRKIEGRRPLGEEACATRNGHPLHGRESWTLGIEHEIFQAQPQRLQGTARRRAAIEEIVHVGCGKFGARRRNHCPPPAAAAIKGGARPRHKQNRATRGKRDASPCKAVHDHGRAVNHA